MVFVADKPEIEMEGVMIAEKSVSLEQATEDLEALLQDEILCAVCGKESALAHSCNICRLPVHIICCPATAETIEEVCE